MDYTTVHLKIHDEGIPASLRRAIAVVWRDHTDEVEFDDFASVGGTTTVEGHDVAMGTVEHIAEDLVRLVPAHTGGEPWPLFGFKVWEEPKYEYLGSLYSYRPGGTLFTCLCDASGDAVMDVAQIKTAIAETTTHEALAARLLALYGETTI